MCTVIVLRETVPGLPLVYAANRDELYERPTDGPVRRDGAILAGVDRLAGGTWMGAREDGLVVALTNQRTHRMPDPSRRSRGGVVTAALATGSREGARAYVEQLRPEDYNGFNLVVGDASGAFVAYVHDGATPELRDLPPGVTVIANDRIGSPEFPRAEYAAARTARIASTPWPRIATELADILSDHTQPEQAPLPPPGSFITPETARAVQALCIHTPRYGTRSATIAAISASGLEHFLVSLEAPCRAPVVDARRLV